MDGTLPVFLILVATAMSVSAVYALYWASRHGQLRNLGEQAHSIFDESEPEGVTSDFFPGRRRRAAQEFPGGGPGAARPNPERCP